MPRNAIDVGRLPKAQNDYGDVLPFLRIGLALIVATVAALAGCAPTRPAPVAADKSAEAKAGITAPPSRTIDNFSAELRYMGTLLVDHGTRALEVMVEDIAEPTQRVKPGTRELLNQIPHRS